MLLIEFDSRWRGYIKGPRPLSIVSMTECMYALMAALTAICALAPVVLAQGGNVPAIRIDSHEVLVSAYVIAKPNGWIVPSLGIEDFHLFEDGKEQRIANVTIERPYSMSFNDNLGTQTEFALTPAGKWGLLYNGAPFTLRDIYVIAYVPPPGAPGSCHQVKVEVTPRGPTGRNSVAAEAYYGPEASQSVKVQVDRRDLVIFYRSEYCSTQHPMFDPLDGMELSKRMEVYASSDRATDNGLSLQAHSFHTRSGATRVHVVLDFPEIGTRGRLGGFTISLLGMAYKKDGELSTRFSDSTYANCFEYSDKLDSHTRRGQYCPELIPTHYEAQVNLAPDEYNLRIVMDYGGVFTRAEVPIVVDKYDATHLAISGIALCRRFHQRTEPRGTLVPMLPFDYVPVVSKGIEFTPAADTRFLRQQPLVAYFEVYEPLLSGTKEVKIQFEMKITDATTEELKTDTGLRSADSFIEVGKTAIPIAEQIAIDKLPPGNYRLEVQASDSYGNKTDWRAASFTVE